MAQRVNGILLIDKEAGGTSFDVVRKLKKCLKVRKVGHAGTLDPFASGLLILLLGQATKLSRFIMSGKKLYEASVRLGIETDTYDKTGKITRTSEVPSLSREFIEKTIRSFLGEISQVPPAYSAVKYKGRRAYELAREGKRFELEPKRVRLYSIKLNSCEMPFLDLRIACASGTYIRSLASDLGKKLGTGGHLIELRRLASGRFRVEEAIKSGGIPVYGDTSSITKKIISLPDALPDMTQIEVNDLMAKRVREGYRPYLKELFEGMNRNFEGDEYFKLTAGSELVGIASIKKDKGVGHDRIEFEKVFL